MSRAVVARLLAGCLAIASIALPGVPDPLVARLFAQARERVLYVSVYDADSLEPVKDLKPEGLVIREDGVRREVLRVTPATSPMPVAVIIDNSAAATPTIADLRRALTGFIKGIDGLGPVALVTVAARPTIARDYTSDQKAPSTRSTPFAEPARWCADSARQRLGRREAKRAAAVNRPRRRRLKAAPALHRRVESVGSARCSTAIGPRQPSDRCTDPRSRATVPTAGRAGAAACGRRPDEPVFSIAARSGGHPESQYRVVYLGRNR
jgi:hypothetical protein